jgi:aconitate hydratase
LRFTGRSSERADLVEAYDKAQGLYRTRHTPDPHFTDTLELDLSTVVPSLAGPRRPQDRVPLNEVSASWKSTLPELLKAAKSDSADRTVPTSLGGESFELGHGAVVIAAITSCTNTSNPSVMMGAGLLARNAHARGLEVKPWVKTSLAPGSQVVTEYLASAGVLKDLEALKFHVVGYGCTTCIGNSGPLPESVSQSVSKGNLVVASVLSGNRNFEGRINPQVRANYLASPPLVVAYALAGHMDFDFDKDALGTDPEGREVYLRDIWPSPADVSHTVRSTLSSQMYRDKYADVFRGDESWQKLKVPTGNRFGWDRESTYVQKPTFFSSMPPEPAALKDIVGARVLAVLGDSVTTDHISPAGSIGVDTPAGKYLLAHGVQKADFNSYGARRGNHEVMVRGTFANVRLKNQLAPGTEGGWTRHQPSGDQMSIYDASVRYEQEGVPLVIIAGKEYGSGSSRDWAAKGTFMLGVRAVIAESYERIHRSNLIGMGVLPLEFLEGQNRDTLGLTGEESFEVLGVAANLAPGKVLTVATTRGGKRSEFKATARIDTLVELEYYKHGGILQYVLRQLVKG